MINLEAYEGHARAALPVCWAGRQTPRLPRVGKKTRASLAVHRDTGAELIDSRKVVNRDPRDRSCTFIVDNSSRALNAGGQTLARPASGGHLHFTRPARRG